MDISEIKDIVEENYRINIKSISKVKNSYNVKADEGEYCIKDIKYNFPHFKFIISAIEHLQKRNFKITPEIIPNKEGNKYIKIEENYAYITKWIPSRVSNFNNSIELQAISRKLAELHECSKGFNLNKEMSPRIGWYSWINVFNTRCSEILDFRKRIYQKAYKSDFDKIYLEHIDSEIERGQRSVKGLKENRYFELMDIEVKKRGFCHHDFAHHNILIDKNQQINVIDFDYCILDTHIHDLSSLLIRAMKDGKWNDKTANLIINSYKEILEVTDEELKIMKYFIMFPQSFWQIGLQYYWEQQPWNQEVFINKINKYLDDVEYREVFLDEYFK
ncbi:MAG: CotS family spore coat protein [Clostridium sp.]|nr:CotS family spore coat protein [Clostridium sp.]